MRLFGDHLVYCGNEAGVSCWHLQGTGLILGYDQDLKYWSIIDSDKQDREKIDFTLLLEMLEEFCSVSFVLHSTEPDIEVGYKNGKLRWVIPDAAQRKCGLKPLARSVLGSATRYAKESIDSLEAYLIVDHGENRGNH